MPSLKRASFPTSGGTFAFGAISGSYQTIFTANGQCLGLLINCTLNTDTEISLNGGTTTFIRIPGGNTQPILIPFGALTAQFNGVVQVRHAGAGPASGVISVGGIFGQ